MTLPAPDLDALIERLLRYSIRINGELMMEQAAAALVQLRAEVALLRDNGTRLLAAADSWKDEAQRLQHVQRWRDEAQITHYPDCWQDHYACAMERIKALEAERDERDGRIKALLSACRRAHALCDFDSIGPANILSAAMDAAKEK